MSKTKKQIREKYIRKRVGKKATSFQIDIPYLDFDGTPTHFTETFNTSDFEYDENLALIAARMKRDEILLQINQQSIQQKVPTVKWFYEQKWKVLPRSVKTRYKQDSRYKQSIIEYEDKPLSAVTVADIQLCINRYAESHSQNETARVLSMWKQIYKCALILGYKIADITPAVIVPKSKHVVKRRDQNTTVSDIETMLLMILEYNPKGKHRRINYAVYYLLSIMYYTGCRPAEVLALNRSDIHDDYISITKSLGSDTEKRDIIVPTKTAESYRNVPVAEDLKPVLRELLTWSDHEQLFFHSDGKRYYNIDEVSDFISRVSRKRNIKFHSYMLRHLVATDLVRSNNDRIAKDVLGHASLGMTIGYARTTNDELLSALDQRSKLFAEKMPKIRPAETNRNAVIRMYMINKILLSIRLLADLKRFEN